MNFINASKHLMLYGRQYLMELKNKLIEVIKNNDKSYVIARCLKNLNQPEFVRLLRGHYEKTFNYATFFVMHNGTMLPDKMVYHISFYRLSLKNCKVRDSTGFCALLHLSLEMILFADTFGLMPAVEWGINSFYYDSGMDCLTQNVFEYYFEPVSQIDCREINNYKNVIESRPSHGYFFVDNRIGYDIKQYEIEKLGYLYKKYVHLNKITKEFIEKSLNSIMAKENRILAIHIRGTDFYNDKKNHPVVISFKEYLVKAKEVFSHGEYDKVFLATDDANALELFKQEFNEKLLYYNDVFRSKNHFGVHATFDNRPLHHYKLGLEVLRDVYTLANCDSLICGLSQVSFAARYVNIALERNFKEIVILDNGINATDSSDAKKYNQQIR